jgi:ParB family transcriptional regulator, chromosome partitioning protein
MTFKKRGLGRGLDALLGAVRQDAGEVPMAPSGGEIRGAPTHLPLHAIQRGRYQPRKDFNPESLRELADSIAAQGVIQPIVVRPVEHGRYEIIAGERRWRACQHIGLEEIPVVVRDVSEQAAVAMGLIENLQRDDLNPLEAASALHRLLDEFALTHQQVAEAVGKSRVTVTNLLRLLDLNDDVKQLIEDNRLEMGHARALLGLKGPQQSEAARQAAHQGLSVRETEKLVRRLQNHSEPGARSTGREAADPNIRQLQDNLTERLGARVSIEHGQRGTGRLVIVYGSLDELEGILEHIR